MPRAAPTHPGNGRDITINYFFDYQCPACRAHAAEVAAVMRANPSIRVIYRDTPIFGPHSVDAARLAMASTYQRRHDAFHLALMTQKMPLDEAGLKAAAASAGLDWARLQRDLATHRAAIDRQLDWNDTLSQMAGISGTPGFLIGQTLVDGALDRAGLSAEIADARKAARRH